jgi:hypothetical protein
VLPQPQSPPTQQELRLQQHANPPDTIDTNLSSIVAFNQSFQAAAEADRETTNQWGKRPAENLPEEVNYDGESKRPHIDESATSDLIPQDTATAVQNQIQEEITNLRASISQTFPEDLQDPQQKDPEFRPDDHAGLQTTNNGQNEPGNEVEVVEQDRMSAMIAAQEANPWLHLMDPSNYALWDANQTLRIQSLPILDNLVSRAMQGNNICSTVSSIFHADLYGI